jgi:hypothetical protein
MTSNSKKNPPLGPIKESFNEEYVSFYNYLLKSRDIFYQFKNFKQTQGKKKTGFSREKFDSYPIYLKHTLFHEEE